MAFMKMLIFIIAMTMALTIAITFRATTRSDPTHTAPEKIPEAAIGLPSTRISRFLASSNANPRASAAKCHKDNTTCDALLGDDYKCCNNKCMDMSDDRDNCGKCKVHCKYTETCCRGECVDINYDQRHCGQCSNACLDKYICFYGTCNYGS